MKTLKKLAKTTEDFIIKNPQLASILTLAIILSFFILNPAYAADSYQSTVKDIFDKLVDVIGFVFQVIGGILTVYSVGQLVMAFKNEDADSKTRATTQVVIGVILVALPKIIDEVVKSLGLFKS